MGKDAICDFSILRELRKQHHLSIQALSESSGVAASVISKLERNRTEGTMDTLYRIARVFRMTLSDLITLAEKRTSHLLEEERYRSGGFQCTRVTYANVRCIHAVAKAGTVLSNPEVHQDDYELCWILKGKVQFTLPNENYELSAGMSLQFDALLEHTYRALEDSELLMVHIRKGKRF